jgi:glycine/D-amino acid oxidase-like deaminating enzyme
MIGAVPGMPHCWVALGYGGNGTTYASIAAGIIAGAITGRPDTDADLYRFSGHARAD